MKLRLNQQPVQHKPGIFQKQFEACETTVSLRQFRSSRCCDFSHGCLPGYNESKNYEFAPSKFPLRTFEYLPSITNTDSVNQKREYQNKNCSKNQNEPVIQNDNSSQYILITKNDIKAI